MEELLEDYKNVVEEYAKNRTDYVFQNQGNEHALIVLSAMFRNAKSYVRMAAGALNNTEVVDRQEYKDALLDFLNKPGTRLNVMVSEYDAKNSPQLFDFLGSLPAYAEGRVGIKYTRGKNFKTSDGKTIHFCVADSCMYRFEFDTNARCAECNMGGSNNALMLEKAFDTAYDGIKNHIKLVG